jgi:hypothetical protein
VVPNSGAKQIERINSSELKKYVGCRGLSDWSILEDTGTGLHVVKDSDAPPTLGDVTTISRNNHGKLLQQPPTALHTVGTDIGYGEGTSPGRYKYALTLVDYTTRYKWSYGLKYKSAESVIDALWCFFVDPGGMPTRIRCDFDSSFVKGKVNTFLKLHRISITSAPPKQQSQNGLVERQWRTAVVMARAMLIEAQLPRRYWFWALREATIRMNLLPCKPTGKTSSPPADSDDDVPTPVEVAQPAKESVYDPVSPPISNPAVRAGPTSTQTGTPPKPRRHGKTDPTLTTPFEFFYGVKPDYRTLVKWGSVGYYRRDSDSGVKRGNFDVQTSVGIALGRSNQTNAMIFWDPGTERMNVSAEYRLDSTASITTHYPDIVYDGHISPLVLRGGQNPNKEPFPPGSKVTILHDNEYLPGTILSVPLSDVGRMRNKRKVKIVDSE